LPCPDDLWLLKYGNHANRDDAGHQDGVKKIASLIRENRMKLLRITPVYGAFIMILAEKHSLIGVGG
jgi:hypothetical protein